MHPAIERRLNRPPHVRGMFGLGDNIMQRPFIRHLAEEKGRLFLQTPWPELYADIPEVSPCRSYTRLRTQEKNERRVPPKLWHRSPSSVLSHKVFYGHSDLAKGSIYQAMEKALGLDLATLDLDLPPLPAHGIETGGKPLAVVRPVTARKEWLNTARNPLPEYVAYAANRLAATHFVVVLADLHNGQEWLVGDLPVADLVLIRGELSTMQALSLVASADVVVGGVGWIVPASIAARRKAFIILGGQGAHNGPEVITDERLDCSRIGFAIPDDYCQCGDKQHNCDKVIIDLSQIFEDWAHQQGVHL
jgi:hypothetical protein